MEITTKERNIILPDDINGVVGWRRWYCHSSEGYLKSLIADYYWKEAIVKTEPPTEPLPYGIKHGFQLWGLGDRPHDLMESVEDKKSIHGIWLVIYGLVELRGKVLQHTDGILRGEWARILCLLIPTQSFQNGDYDRLSHYQVPMYNVSTLENFNDVLDNANKVFEGRKVAGEIREIEREDSVIDSIINSEDLSSSVEVKIIEIDIMKLMCKIDELIDYMHNMDDKNSRIVVSNEEYQALTYGLSHMQAPYYGNNSFPKIKLYSSGGFTKSNTNEFTYKGRKVIPTIYHKNTPFVV